VKTYDAHFRSDAKWFNYRKFSFVCSVIFITTTTGTVAPTTTTTVATTITTALSLLAIVG